MKFLTLFIFISISSFSQSEKFHTPESTFEIGSSQFLYGNDVKLRELPNLDSEVLDLLKIGSKIEILDIYTFTLVYNGYQSPFYKVKANNKIGYILGGLIAIEKKNIDSVDYFINYKKIKTSENDSENILIRCIINNEIIEISNKLQNTFFTFRLSDNKGVKTINHIIIIDYQSEACGEEGGISYFFQYENKLEHIIDTSSIADAGVYYTNEELIFPSENENINSNKIIYNYQEEITIDESNNHSKKTTINFEVEFINGKLQPNIKDELKKGL